jgi:hypothetical protein
MVTRDTFRALGTKVRTIRKGRGSYMTLSLLLQEYSGCQGICRCTRP